MKVYFLRHGESEYNVKHLINQDPKVKVPLTKKGIKQAVKVAKKLKDVRFDAIYISELFRAKQTAEIVNKYHNLPVKVEPRICEVRVGFEGKSDKEFHAIAGSDLFHFKGNGIESWQGVKKRVRNFLRDLKKKKYETVLVVTHQWVIKVANQVVKGLSDEEAYTLPMGNCDFIILEV